MESNVCLFDYYGFCKLKDKCPKDHLPTCPHVATCNQEDCKKLNRHPKPCRHTNGCKFKNCRYLHVKNQNVGQRIDDRIDKLIKARLSKIDTDIIDNIIRERIDKIVAPRMVSEASVSKNKESIDNKGGEESSDYAHKNKAQLWQCNTCGKEFKFKRTYKRHIFKMHGPKPNEIDNCEHNGSKTTLCNEQAALKRIKEINANILQKANCKINVNDNLAYAGMNEGIDLKLHDKIEHLLYPVNIYKDQFNNYKHVFHRDHKKEVFWWISHRFYLLVDNEKIAIPLKIELIEIDSPEYDDGIYSHEDIKHADDFSYIGNLTPIKQIICCLSCENNPPYKKKAAIENHGSFSENEYSSSEEEDYVNKSSTDDSSSSDNIQSSIKKESVRGTSSLSMQEQQQEAAENQEDQFSVIRDDTGKELGMIIAGNSNNVYIRKLTHYSRADDARLRVHDKLLSVNGISCLNMDHSEVANIFKCADSKFQIVARRKGWIYNLKTTLYNYDSEWEEWELGSVQQPINSSGGEVRSQSSSRSSSPEPWRSRSVYIPEMTPHTVPVRGPSSSSSEEPENSGRRQSSSSVDLITF